MPRSPITQVAIIRALKAVGAAGVAIGRVEIAPDGTVIVIPSGAGVPVANDPDELSPIDRRRARLGKD